MARRRLRASIGARPRKEPGMPTIGPRRNAMPLAAELGPAPEPGWRYPDGCLAEDRRAGPPAGPRPLRAAAGRPSRSVVPPDEDGQSAPMAA